MQVFSPQEKCRKMIVRDESDTSHLTVWRPYDDSVDSVSVGAKIRVFDARVSDFYGRSLDTSAGTVIEVRHI